MSNPMKIHIFVSISLLILSCPPPPNPAVEGDEKHSPLTQRIDSLLKATSYNGTIIVARQGEVIYQAAQGLRDFRTGDSLRIQTPFYLGSVAK